MLEASKRFGLPIVLLLVMLRPVPCGADVTVRTSESTVAQDRPIQVTFEASGSSVALPDLAPLEADFDILNRGVQQRSSTINGRRMQRTTLSLTLRAKKTGTLEIPSLRFGGETSRPVTITVVAGAEPAPGPIQDGTGPFSPWDPLGMQAPQFGMPWGGMEPGWGPPALDGIQQSFPPAFPPSSDDQVRRPSTQLNRTDSSGAGAIPADAPLLPPIPTEERPANAWSWIAGFAVAGWLGTLFVCWLRRHRRGLGKTAGPTAERAATETRQQEPEPESEDSRATRAVAAAYAAGNAAAAREALLSWGRITWPASPPGNLSRLADRLQEPLRGYVLELDEALYSPTPTSWESRPVADLLGSAGN